jgi:hypothetical protein
MLDHVLHRNQSSPKVESHGVHVAEHSLIHDPSFVNHFAIWLIDYGQTLESGLPTMVEVALNRGKSVGMTFSTMAVASLPAARCVDARR